MSSGVFISYRRADAQGWSGRLETDLAAAFGEAARFFDLTSIPPGADFVNAIERALAGSVAVLVLIGPHWLDVRDNSGRRRLDAPDDVVAHEILHALTLPVPLIPVLLGGTQMPTAAALPEGIRALARRNAIELSELRWAHDVDRLLRVLEASTALRRRPAPGLADVIVGAGLHLRDVEIGQVTGVRGGQSGGSVEVLRGAVIEGGRMGDITGVDIGPAPKRELGG
jgi:hypothetical protein